LAVDREFQGRGYGAALLMEAVRRVAGLSNHVGIAGLFVDAKDDSAIQFYQHFGFLSLPSNSRRLFLPLEPLLCVANALRGS
jgi:ribosomal protein S18 acetylase RimI-like enzyme